MARNSRRPDQGEQGWQKTGYRMEDAPCNHAMPVNDQNDTGFVQSDREGDWQMDLIVDSFGHAILTLTETATSMLMMEKLRFGKRARPLAKVVSRMLLPFKGDGVKTITTDNGSEFAAHQDITKAIGAKVYFADSYCSWQKGAIENMNKLIRQYIPKSANFADFSNKKIMEIQKKINRRPREKLNFSTPVREFYNFFN